MSDQWEGTKRICFSAGGEKISHRGMRGGNFSEEKRKIYERSGIFLKYPDQTNEEYISLSKTHKYFDRTDPLGESKNSPCIVGPVRMHYSSEDWAIRTYKYPLMDRLNDGKKKNSLIFFVILRRHSSGYTYSECMQNALWMMVKTLGPNMLQNVTYSLY
ncbi:MAG: hypothetical protein ACD_71C00104G0006 [uncultured bacterium (gcode 4)]|uniref:Uncharacterized protein n=1 Tax=uncultured bacterium (gcode 4) TaxID=1234023 RepID=K2A3D8_9BACT|nr:MAG: hypothetical protein ACD_71C00104G0006 [uncultured bacterium (gcode 4)]